MVDELEQAGLAGVSSSAATLLAPRVADSGQELVGRTAGTASSFRPAVEA